MTDNRLQRRLAAILAADVVGYSRLMGLDESGTLAAIKAWDREILKPALAQHSGRMVKLMGDGVLAEFASAVDAVECAIAMQKAMAIQNEPRPEDRKLNLRMGINLGDVIVEDDDLYGDGVNLAARLEAFAEPGGICVSDDAYRQVRDKLDVEFEDLGEQQLKNISRPLRIFSVRQNEGAEAETSSRKPKPVLPDKPSIAVLPFTNMSGDVEQEYFVDGMVEDIITALSRFNQLFVIARNSSFVYKGRAVDIKQVGQELGVRYVLEGSVRKAGHRVRITGQLIDSSNGSHLWADRFDGELQDVFDLQDQITAQVIGAIEPTVRKAEIERARRKPVHNLDAYDLYLQALPYIYVIRPDDNLKALGLLHRSIELDPSYAPALAHAAWCRVQRITRAWEPYGEDDVESAVELARRALATGSDDATSVVLGGFVLVMLGADYSAGLSALRRALEMNPGSGFINAIAGSGMVFGDEGEKGLELLEKAMALGPLDPNYFVYLTVAATAHLFAGRPEKAAELTEKSAALNDDWDSTFWVMVTAYVQLDRMAEAQTMLSKLLKASPCATLASYEDRLPVRNPKSRQLIIQSLRQAGLPEGE